MNNSNPIFPIRKKSLNNQSINNTEDQVLLDGLTRID